MRKTIYTCDRCGREVEQPRDLTKMPMPARVVTLMPMPARVVNYSRSTSHGPVQPPKCGRSEAGIHGIELCQVCMNDLHRLCERQFARITVSNIGVKIEARGLGAVGTEAEEIW